MEINSSPQANQGPVIGIIVVVIALVVASIAFFNRFAPLPEEEDMATTPSATTSPDFAPATTSPAQ